MDCTHVKDRLSDLLDGRLDEEERQAVESHLATCADCRAEKEGLEKTVAMVSALPRLAAPPDMAARVLSQARHEADAPPLASPARPRALPYLRALGAAAVVLIFAAVGYRAVFYEPGTGLVQAPAMEKGMDAPADPKAGTKLRRGLVDERSLGKALERSSKEVKNGLGMIQQEKKKADGGLAEGEEAEKAEDRLAGRARRVEEHAKGARTKEERSRDKSPATDGGTAGRWAKAKDDAPSDRGEAGPRPEKDAEKPGAPKKAPASKPGAPGYRAGDSPKPSGAPRPAAGKPSPRARRSRGGSADARKAREKQEDLKRLESLRKKSVPPSVDVRILSANVSADENVIHELLERAVNPHGYGSAPEGAPSESADQGSEKEGRKKGRVDDGKAGTRPASKKGKLAVQKTITVTLTAAEYRAFMSALRRSRVHRNRVQSSESPRVLELLERMAERERKQGRGPGAAPPAPSEPGAPSPTPTPTPSPTPTPGPTPNPAAGGAPPAPPSGGPPPHAEPPRGAGRDAWDEESGDDEQGYAPVPWSKRPRIVLRIVLVQNK